MTVQYWLEAHNKSLAECVREESALVHEGAVNNTIEVRVTVLLDIAGDVWECDRVIKMRMRKEHGHKCEDCEGDSFGRRTRCPICRLLVCSWCYSHVHNISMSGFNPNACGSQR